jgi:hypothetical protein
MLSAKAPLVRLPGIKKVVRLNHPLPNGLTVVLCEAKPVGKWSDVFDQQYSVL